MQLRYRSPPDWLFGVDVALITSVAVRGLLANHDCRVLAAARTHRAGRLLE
jgi:hypothetical protein